ncbi:DNA-binding response regulator [Streptomyces radicis]|uniref:DNA-binding response regulator n=2 Tax=Streptomyces radicis TaxID=1750517 RepID=A0A3A9VVN3_9ACTN|nr:DNA-binding response regulator [Streptomyces radicis]RKN14741.1 DNA-binding response regulator [Streptomyces radicis]
MRTGPRCVTIDGTPHDVRGGPALRPHVAVLDVRLPDGDGITVCRELRSAMPELACLMLTSFDDDDALAALSPREREILVLVGEGLTNRQIGQRLCLSEKTVKNHISRMLAKLGVERRVQAAVLAGRVTPPRA